MKFCPIMPISAFEKFKNSSDHWMALAQYLHLEEYLKFFQEKIEKGETVILDNGAYEGVPMQAWRLAALVKELNPTVVVLPDVPGKFAKTLVGVDDYLNRFGLPKGTAGMTVLHAPDGKRQQFETAYGMVCTEWVGFSRLTKSYGHGVQWPYHRVSFATYLHASEQWRGELKHHALGMLRGNVQELKALNGVGFHSCDSSAPIWRGMHGYEVDEVDWPDYSMEPLCAPEAANWEMAERNLAVTLEACNGKS